MNNNEIAELFNRLGRLVSASKNNSGDGMEWDYTFPNGETHRYVIKGLKSHADAEDSAFNLLIWIWNAKDYLKKRAELIGTNGRVIENTINDDVNLLICGDLANRLKHGRLDRQSRSGLNPRFGNISFEAQQAAIGSLTFRAFDVEIMIDDPSQVTYRLPVFNEQDEEIGDAFVYADKAIRTLERLRNKIEGIV